MKKRSGVMAVFLLVVAAAGVRAVPQRAKIVNRTGYTIIEVNIAPVAADEWGADLLAGDELTDEDSRVFALSDEYSAGDSEFVDVRLVDVDGDEYIRSGINFSDGKEIIVTFDDYKEREREEDFDSPEEYEQVYEAGYEEGFKKGKEEGYTEGYSQGFKDGNKRGSAKEP